MRNVINPQMLLDGADIGSIYLDPRSRDDIPQILRGLQHIYTDPNAIKLAHFIDTLDEADAHRSHRNSGDMIFRDAIYRGWPSISQRTLPVFAATSLHRL